MTDLQNLKPGDKFFYKNVGYGVISYERGDDAVEVKDGLLYTECFNSIGMEWKRDTWVFDSGLGLVTSIVGPDDIAAIAFCAEDADD